jgi:hypothetical protein
VLPQNQPEIYLDREYPCPCHINGKLQQIVLTEAFACERCRRIFVVQPDRCTIEELATTYPYKRRYVWTGTRWQVFRSFPGNQFWTSLRPWLNWVLWLQGLGLVILLLAVIRLYFRSIVVSPILNLVLSMAVAIFVFIIIVITLWLFNQG